MDHATSVTQHLLAVTPEAVRSCGMRISERNHAMLHDQLRAGLRSVTRAEYAKQDGVQVHAAACQLPSGTGLLLPGRTGAGKSTFAALLAAEQSAAIIADDSVVIRAGRAHGLGLPLTLRRSSPYRDRAQALWYADGSERLLVHPDDLGGRVIPSVSVDLIVFPTFGDHADLQQMSPAAAFCGLSSMLMRPAEDDAILALANVAASNVAFSAHYRSIPEALKVIDETDRNDPQASFIAPERLDRSLLTGFNENVWGVRFGDEVVLFNRTANQVAHIASWPEGTALPLTSWTAIVNELRST